MLLQDFTDEFISLALAVCNYTEFNADFAKTLTGDENIVNTIDYIRRTTAQLVDRSYGWYSFRPEMVQFFKWEQERVWSQSEYEDNYRKVS